MNQDTSKISEEIIRNTQQISALPSIALDLMTRLNSSESIDSKLVQKIELDPVIVSYILRNCNSPLYGVRKEVTSVNQAVNMLGFTRLKSILTSYFMKHLCSLAVKEYVSDYLWNHSVTVAVLARDLAESFGLDKEQAYLAGLLHDIGKLVLLFYDIGNYEMIFNEAMEKKETLLFVEKDYYGVSHVNTGAAIVKKWGFPDFVIRSVEFHHVGSLSNSPDKVCMVCAFANALAHKAMDTEKIDAGVFFDYFKVSEEDVNKIVLESLARISEIQAVM